MFNVDVCCLAGEGCRLIHGDLFTNLEGHVCCAVVTGMNIISILYVVLAGSPFGQASNLTPFAPHGIPGIFAGAAIVYFSFIGFDMVATVAEEVRPLPPWCHCPVLMATH